MHSISYTYCANAPGGSRRHTRRATAHYPPIAVCARAVANMYTVKQRPTGPRGRGLYLCS
eukprot:4543679-Prymnesium_polylepis.2